MLLTLWTKHGLFQGDHREEALDEVRKKVLGYYQKRVQEEEDRAKIEFDEAVAISDDGHSIFKANEVVVVTRHRGSYCFTSVSFSGDKKIRKYGKLIKSEEPLGTDRLFTAVQSNPASMVQTYVARMIDEVRSGNADQALVRIGSHTVLFTESSLCEDPIPFDQGKRIA